MRPAGIVGKGALMALIVFLVALSLPAAAQKSTSPAKPAAAPIPAGNQLPQLWHSVASHKDFRLEIKGDLFRADWVNIPAAAAKDGASMRIECRRTGSKWVGSASVHQAIAISKDPTSNETKMCHFTVRFEVDAITPQKISFHTEALRNIDPAKCELLQTAWEAFSWVPKK